MKKFVYHFVMGLLLFVATSCGEDSVLTKKEIETSVEELIFRSGGDIQIISITASDVEWRIIPSDNWIKCTVHPERPNEVVVKVDVWDNFEPRVGEIRIESLDNDVPSIVVKVTQSPVQLATFIWDRTTAQRLHLKGKIEKVSYLDALSRDGAAIYDLVFNESGMLTQFTHKKNSTKTVTVDIEYDAKNRLTLIKGLGVEDDYEFVFEYGNHGKYIPMEELFNDLSMNSGKVINHTLWMPMLVKNLSKVSLIDKQKQSNSVECIAKVEGDNATMSSGDVADFYKYTFDGEFIKTVAFKVWFNDVLKTYTINKENGALLKTEEVDSEGSIIIDFNADLSNSIKSMVSTFTGKDFFEYNDNLDVIKHHKDDKLFASRSYQYDELGNWIIASDSKNGEINREITYR